MWKEKKSFFLCLGVSVLYINKKECLYFNSTIQHTEKGKQTFFIRVSFAPDLHHSACASRQTV